jgi:hypothetical protein
VTFFKDQIPINQSLTSLTAELGGKRDPRLSSIERIAEAMGMTVLIVPEAMAPELRRYIAHNGRTYTTKPFTSQPTTSQSSDPADKATAAPEPTRPDHAPQKA